MKKIRLLVLFFCLFFVSSSLFGDIVWIEPYTVNAAKGDMLLTGSPNGMIGETMAAGFGGYWSHTGMMIDDGYNIRHNSFDVNDLRLNTNWLGVPTSVNSDDLEHGQPGLKTQTTQWVGSTDVVVKPTDVNEAAYRPLLEDVADKTIWLEDYYRIHSYINSSVVDWIDQFNNSNTLTSHKGGHCSGQIWYGNYLLGKEMNVYYGTTDQVDAGALALYQSLYEMILEEVEEQGGFWGSAFDWLGIIDYESVAKKIANQVTNAFGLDVYNDTSDTWRSAIPSAGFNVVAVCSP